MVAAFVLTAIYLRAIRRGRLYQVVTGRGYRAAPLRLARARGIHLSGARQAPKFGQTKALQTRSL